VRNPADASSTFRHRTYTNKDQTYNLPPISKSPSAIRAYRQEFIAIFLGGQVGVLLKDLSEKIAFTVSHRIRDFIKRSGVRFQ
jgi:hypothetical protein